MRDFHEPDGLLYMDGTLVIPFSLKNAVLKTLHEANTSQIGMKYLAQHIWWPHINCQIYFHGISFSVRVDHASFLTSQDFKSCCGSIYTK